MMIAIGDRVWSEKRKRLIDDLKDAEIDSSERIVALRELDSSRGMMSEVVHHAISVSGALDIIAEAAKSKTAENAAGLPDAIEGSSEDVIKIALALIGAELDTEPEDSDKPKGKTKKK
jgi:hypothetical protein